MIVNVLELRTDQPSKLAIIAIIDRAEGTLTGSQQSICGVKRNIRRDPTACLVGIVEQSADLT